MNRIKTILRIIYLQILADHCPCCGGNQVVANGECPHCRYLIADIEKLRDELDSVMNVREFKTIQKLRDRGFAVVVWYKFELGNATPRKVENRTIELGHEVIRDLQ